MILLNLETKEPFTTLYYELTWKIGWEQMISFAEVLLRDFAKNGLQSIEVGYTGCAPEDVTRDLLSHGMKIWETDFSKDEKSCIVIAGHSEINDIPMRITLWNQTNRCMVNLKDDELIPIKGEHAYDRYMNSLEIMGHVEYARKKEREAVENKDAVTGEAKE